MNGRQRRRVLMALIGGALMALFVLAVAVYRDNIVRAASLSWVLPEEDIWDNALVPSESTGVDTAIETLKLSVNSLTYNINASAAGTQEFAAVRIVSGLDVRAVIYTATFGAVYHWNGSGWTQRYSVGASLRGLAMPTANYGLAVGNATYAVYTAAGWSAQTAVYNMFAVDMIDGLEGPDGFGFAVGAEFCAGGGGNKCQLFRKVGYKWSVTTTGVNNTNTLFDVDIIGSSSATAKVWAVGAAGNIFRSLNPSAATPSWAVATPVTTALRGISMLSDGSQGWAVGDNGRIVTCTTGVNCDNNTWTVVTGSANPFDNQARYTFYDVKAVAANEAWAVGYDSTGTSALVIKWNGTSWSSVTLTPDTAGNVRLYGIDYSGVGGVFVGGSGGAGVQIARKYGGYCPGASGACTGYTGYGVWLIDTDAAATWGAHSYSGNAGAGTITFEFSGSNDGSSYSPWMNAATVNGKVYQYLKQRITLSTTNWLATPSVSTSGIDYTTPDGGGGGGWIAAIGPTDLRTWVYSNRVLVLFTPKASTTYTVYRHSYEAVYDRAYAVVGSVTINASGGIASSSPAGVWSRSDPWFPGRLVFTDTYVQNFQEYYYFVSDKVYGPDPAKGASLADFIVVSAFPPTQTRHGNFTEHTNACTACHGLHSSPSRGVLGSPQPAPGRGKLWKAPTAIDLCRGCHDGTGSKYDEANGWVRLGVTWAVYTTAPAGPYGALLGGELVQMESQITSRHDIGRVLVNQAPGGGYKTSPTSWTNQFSCISCHEAHNRYRNYRLLRGAVHPTATTHVRVRGYSEVDVSTATYATYAEYIAGFSSFCGQCHVAFYSEVLARTDKTTSSVYGVYRHITAGVYATPAFYTAAMGVYAQVVGIYDYPYPFEDADPERPALLPNRDLPLQGTYTAANYVYNQITCLTCHWAHGTLRTGQKQVAYFNGRLVNNTVYAVGYYDQYAGSIATQSVYLSAYSSVYDVYGHRYWPYTERWGAVYDRTYGGSTVLMRTNNAGLCQTCHQKTVTGSVYPAYVPKLWFWDGSADRWTKDNISCSVARNIYNLYNAVYDIYYDVYRYDGKSCNDPGVN